MKFYAEKDPGNFRLVSDDEAQIIGIHGLVSAKKFRLRAYELTNEGHEAMNIQMLEIFDRAQALGCGVVCE
jgi:hypothetical protein